MQKIHYKQLEADGIGFYGVLAVLGGIVAIGLGCAYYMEHNGHVVTGMTNQVVWGTPHIFAIFLILAASSCL